MKTRTTATIASTTAALLLGGWLVSQRVTAKPEASHATDRARHQAR